MTGPGLHCKRVTPAAEGMGIVGAQPRQGAEVEDSDSGPGVVECHSRER